MKKLVQLNNQIKKLQKEFEIEIDVFLKDISKTLKEWKSLLSENQFDAAVQEYMQTTKEFISGTNYTLWTLEGQRSEFYSSKLEKLLEDDTKLLYAKNCKFFVIKTEIDIHSPCSTRDSVFVFTQEIEDNKFKYHYELTYYDGFNNVVSNGYQRFEVNLVNDDIEYYHCSIKDNRKR